MRPTFSSAASVTLVLLAAVACKRADGDGVGKGAPSAAPARFSCQKMPTYTIDRVCLKSRSECVEYSGGGECFESASAWCLWRFGGSADAPSSERQSICMATERECEHNRAEMQAWQGPTLCVESSNPAEW